ncbi:hypothetical protein JOB18_002623 [Solea senegalensis]|uniref:Uncharacterized protein n=1 Tax=Solea senegalensis TaxID=28829 RepID=A0AAV6PF75_SOLSE|nr:hypothetical protein JOB18_002623 [Solea senegalensis]
MIIIIIFFLKKTSSSIKHVLFLQVWLQPLVSGSPSLHCIPFSPLHLPLHIHSTLLSYSSKPHTSLPPFSFAHPPQIGTPPPALGSSISSSHPSPGLVSTAVVSEGQMTGELAPGRALSHPGAIRLVANNRCFRPGEDQSGGIMGNVQSSAFYTSAQMDEITLVSF